jgi:hypothetical protein
MIGNNLKKRVEELERHGAFIAFANGTQTYNPTSTRELSQLMSDQNMQNLNKMLTSRDAQDKYRQQQRKQSPTAAYVTPPSELEPGSSTSESLRSPSVSSLSDHRSFISPGDHQFMNYQPQQSPMSQQADPMNSAWQQQDQGHDMTSLLNQDGSMPQIHDFGNSNMFGEEVVTTSSHSGSENGDLHFTPESYQNSNLPSPSVSPRRIPRNSTVLTKSQGSRQGSIDESDIRGRTPLHLAAMRGYLQIVLLLIAKGIDVDAKDNQGWTALHLAVERGHQPIVQALLDAGANPHGKVER